MDYEDMKSELENAGIDAFDFYLMGEDERKEALEDAFLDPDDFEYFDIEYECNDDNYVPAHSQPSISVPEISSASKPAPSAPPSPPVQRQSVDLSSYQDRSNICESVGIAQQHQAEIAKIDRKLKNIRAAIFSLLVLLFLIIGAGMASANRSRNPSAGTYYTPRPGTVTNPTPKAVSTPVSTPSYPYEGMPESQLYNTGLGAPTAIEKDINFEYYRPIRQYKKYVWKKNGAPYFTATTSYWKDGKEVPGYVSSIWRSKDFKNSNGLVSAPYIGKQLSRYDDELYFLGGGGKIGGVSTSKFRYSVGSKTYVVYLDNDYVVRKIEDYLPKSSTKKSSSSSKKSTDPYHANDYTHPDDFYDWYEDDFWDYEDAEDYWEEYG